jgi:hypothetical protein
VPCRLLIASWLLAVIRLDSASKAAVVMVMFRLSVWWAPLFNYSLTTFLSNILQVPSSDGLTDGKSFNSYSMRGFNSSESLTYASCSFYFALVIVLPLICDLSNYYFLGFV